MALHPIDYQRPDMSDSPENELQDANENPWYVLATVFGEQTGGQIDHELARKNRSVWNAWALSEHSWEKKLAFFDSLPERFDRRLLANVQATEHWEREARAAFAERLDGWEEAHGLPSPGEVIDLAELEFDCQLVFIGYIFPSRVSLFGARARRNVTFQGAVFLEEALFSFFRTSLGVSLDDALFGSICSFDRAEIRGVFIRKTVFMSEPPMFEATQLDHVQLTADEAFWPAINSDNIQENTKGGYITLRRMMADRQDTDMEHFFYRQEMRCLIAENADNFWKRLPYQAFRVFSDFGHSIARPVQWLAGLWGVMTFIYALGFIFGDRPVSYEVGTVLERFELFGFSAAYSASNTFAFLGFRGLYLEEIVRDMAGWIQIASAAQTMASFALLFFLALALRNRFRLT